VAVNGPDEHSREISNRRRAALGIFLILAGSGLLVTRWLGMAWVPPWVAGLGLLVAGASRRQVRLIVAGGILTGAGLAIAVQSGPWIPALSNPARTSLFLGCLALGWLLVPPLARLAAGQALWWPLVPGTVLGVTAVAFWVSAAWVQAVCSLAWPALLCLAGLILIVRWNRSK
jgi:hypothetical protein